MRWIKRFTCLQFDEDNTFDYQIRVVGSYRLPMEPDWNRSLSLEIDTALFEGHRHRFFINFFQKPKAEFVVDLIKDTNNLFSQF